MENTKIFKKLFSDDDDDDLPSFPEDLPDDFELETTDQNQIAFPPQTATIVAGSGYPEPTLVPGKEGGKLKTFYKCEKCSKYKKV